MSNGSECPGWEIVPSPQEIISGTIAPFADPETVSISFAAKQAMMIVSRLVRLGWMATPPEGDQGPGAVGSWMQQHSNLEPLVESELNPDTEDVYSEWRKSLYHTQNHIFYDIMNFTSMFGPESGVVYHLSDPKNPPWQTQPIHPTLHFHVPNHDTFVICFPMHDESRPLFNVKVDALLCLAYIAPGVSIHAPAYPDLGAMSETCQSCVWFVRHDVSLELEIKLEEGLEHTPRTGVAAVFVYGKLCRGQKAAPSAPNVDVDDPGKSQGSDVEVTLKDVSSGNKANDAVD